MTETRRVIFLFILILLPCMLFAQTGVSLEAEIQNIEGIIAGQGISPAEKHEALVRLARLRQLSGDIEGAAKNWLEAAGAIPGQIDDNALLACAYCFAAMGEWDRARGALEPLLTRSFRARFLEISINAINTGNTFALAAIAENPEYSQMQSEIFFLLWSLSSGPTAERWRERLVAEFPQSPEGRLASAGNSREIMLRPSPFWLFMGGLDSLPLVETQHVATQHPAEVQTSATGTRLQTGLFGRRDNANAQMTSLRQAGFSPSVEQRIVNNNEMWAVIVFAGADTNRTIRELRDAGFESFPLR